MFFQKRAVKKSSAQEETVKKIKPAKWYEIYPHGTKEGNEELLFFKAISRHPKYEYRSIQALVKETGLDIERIEQIIDKYARKVNPPLLYQHPKHENHWGYWERCKPDAGIIQENLVLKKDREKRIQKKIKV